MSYGGHFVFETRTVTIRLAFPAVYLLCIFCANLMMLAAICQDFEHLNDFHTIGSGGHFCLSK